ncbi:mannose-6-phosphate isomerase, class I [Jeotgalibacillus marinus]|uniref:Mannose-6-phosphate isomerase n=1 Tax=Jeotgalibacillus marinus TaxID=86667 RepID=A0ABV3Q522_9BACL
MNRAPIFLQPIFQERIWGGTQLRDRFGYEIPSDHTGECWAISAHPNGPSTVIEGEYKGKTLAELWKNHKELFGHSSGEVFPLLTKILDASNDLSVQVHPDDTYAKEHENGELGKTECWYVIDCAEGAEIIFGHNAQTKEEFISAINNHEWNTLLKRVKVKPGDFFYVPSGTIHALCSGVLILETQQSSDTTYRVYDYDRVGNDGQKRELHLEKSIDVTTIPHQDSPTLPTKEDINGGTVTTYVEATYFSVYKWDINGNAVFQQDQPYMLVSVIEGEGTITTQQGTFDLHKGDHFILPNDLGELEITGNIQLIVSHP